MNWWSGGTQDDFELACEQLTTELVERHAVPPLVAAKLADDLLQIVIEQQDMPAAIQVYLGDTPARPLDAVSFANWLRWMKRPRVEEAAPARSSA